MSYGSISQASHLNPVEEDSDSYRWPDRITGARAITQCARIDSRSCPSLRDTLRMAGKGELSFGPFVLTFATAIVLLDFIE